MRQNIIAANWKMNKNLEEGIQLAVAVKENLQAEVDDDKIGILCPPFIHLFHLAEMLKDIDHLHVGAQNCHQEESGAYTGEIAAGMIQSIGANYVILSHSERRKYFGETNEVLAKKVDMALRHSLNPIFCCGETLEQREEGRHKEIVEEQVRDGLFHLNEESFKKVVIAYEPVWAIGTGKTATPAQAPKCMRSSVP
jgi:triosephosphate isomerase